MFKAKTCLHGRQGAPAQEAQGHGALSAWVILTPPRAFLVALMAYGFPGRKIPLIILLPAGSLLGHCLIYRIFLVG